MRELRLEWLKRLPGLFEITARNADRSRQRILLMERNTMLPVKVVCSLIIYNSFNYRSPWMSQALSALDVTVEAVQVVFGFYLLLNLLFAVPLLAGRKVPLAVLQWTVVMSALLDGLLMAGLTLITGGLDSILFWLFIGLILRNAISIPPGFSQLVLNFATSLCYGLVALLDNTIMANLDDTTRRALDMTAHEDMGEPFLLRMLVLWLVALTCHSVQAFLEKQRAAMEEAQEFAAREGQLHAAGRLAAEFAHQIKNPLAIIRNAAHSLDRSVREKKPVSPLQIEIIREEVARADQAITQIMGYAQLSEGRVEKIDLAPEIQRLVAQVFPPAVPTEIQLQVELSKNYPPLLMQRGHLSEVILNLLTNAREAINGPGKVTLNAETLRDLTVV
ncbi:MAG TPA: histidine kinase dimerization/phospho-acceptor domain-containing protein, partial [Verrucomicrobiae bacterium]